MGRYFRNQNNPCVWSLPTYIEEKTVLLANVFSCLGDLVLR
jgi:hypothetical protein